MPLDTVNCERVVETEARVVAGDVGDDPDLARRPPCAAFGLACYIGAPVVVDGEVWGTVCFYGETPREGFDEWAVTLVDLLCRWVGTALDRERDTERLAELASIASHDLRNPLQVLSGALDLAEETGEAEQFDRCRRAVDRMETLIENLLALASGSDPDVESVDLGGLAAQCWETVETGDADLRLETDATVRADEGQLGRLLENLLRNAVEHAGPGVTVTVGEHDGGFYVEDDGTGIPPEDRTRVFEWGHSTGDGRTGIGLHIVERVAEAHGWTVSVTEGQAGGARFEFGGVETDE